jgi:hypothetical protein
MVYELAQLMPAICFPMAKFGGIFTTQLDDILYEAV